MTMKIKKNTDELTINKIYAQHTIDRILEEQKNCKVIYTDKNKIDFAFNWGKQKMKLRQILKKIENGKNITYLILEPIEIKNI